MPDVPRIVITGTSSVKRRKGWKRRWRGPSYRVMNIVLPPVNLTNGYQSDADEGTDFDWYVCNTTGHDTNNDGTSVGSAFATIGKAISVAQSGETIGVRNQSDIDYNEEITLPIGVTLSGYSTEKPVLSGGVDLGTGVQCTVADEARVGSNYSSVYKVTGISKTQFVNDDPYNANLVEDGRPMTIAMGRNPNPEYRNLESYNEDWWNADSVNTTVVDDGDGPVTIIVSHVYSGLSDYTEAQILQCDIRFHRAPNGADRTPVASYDSGTTTITFDRTGYLPDDPEYETNEYKNRFCLVNLLPAIQRGQWAFWDNGDGTVDVYYWPQSVSAGIQYTTLENAIDGRNSYDCTVKSFVIQQYAATNLSTGASCALRFDAPAGGNIGAFTLDNLLVRRNYSKGDGYGHLYAANHDGYSITNCTFEDGRNMFGVFLAGRHYDKVADRTLNGRFQNNVVIRADKSPIRVYGNRYLILSRNWFIDSGRAAHANKGNHYEGGSNTLWVHNIWFACSGYWTFQESDSQDFMFNYIPTNFNDGRAIVDQNKGTFPSWATFNNSNGDTYILNNTSPVTHNAVALATFNAFSGLGLTEDTAVMFAVMNNIFHGDSATLPEFIIPNGWKTNTYTGGTKRDTTDVNTDYSLIFSDVLVGDFEELDTSPTLTAATTSIVSLPGTDGSVLLADRWSMYDFTKDINGDTIDLSNPPMGAAANPANYPDLAPVWIERPVISGVQTDGNTLTVSDGVCMFMKNYEAPVHQWMITDDPYSDPETWTEIPLATGSSFVVTSAQVGYYIGTRSTSRDAVAYQLMAAPAQSSFPLGTPTSLLANNQMGESNLAANTWHEFDAITTSNKPIVLLLNHICSTFGATPTLTFTIGAAGRTGGTGTSITVDATQWIRTRNQSAIAFLAAPGSGSQTIQMSSTDITWDAHLTVLEIEGATGIAVSGEFEGSSGTSVTPECTTTATNSIVLYDICRYNGAGGAMSIASATVLAEGASSATGGASDSIRAIVAYEQAGSIGTYSREVTWAASAGAYTGGTVEVLS